MGDGELRALGLRRNLKSAVRHGYSLFELLLACRAEFGRKRGKMHDLCRGAAAGVRRGGARRV
jgi:hypothetical protein